MVKKLFLSFLCLVAGLSLSAQLKTSNICPTLVVDILDGNVNKIPTDYTAEQVKKAIPCFTSEQPVTASCGAAIFYKDKGVSFFTGRGYVEINDKFKGKMTIPLMGAARNGLFKWLGLPKIKDISWDAYQTSYGTLVVHFNKVNKVNLVQFSKKSTDELTLCQ